MLELPNFGHMITSTISFESRDKTLFVTSQSGIMTPYPLFRNAFISRRPGVANFANIIRIVIMSIKKLLKNQKKLKN